MATKEIKVPDLGGADEVEVIEILVSEGDTITIDDALITMEGDKASMDMPAPQAGVVKSIKVKVGDKISENDLVLVLETEADSKPESKEESTEKTSDKTDDTAKKSADSGATQTQEIKIPDLSGAENVDVIELLVEPGSKVEKDDSLITLEGDKASMDVPAPMSGLLKSFKLKVGDKVNQGDALAIMEVSAGEAQPESKPESSEAKEKNQEDREKDKKPDEKIPDITEATHTNGDTVHAGPAVRRMARELGVDLHKVKGTGNKGRVVKEDIHKYVKSALASSGATVTSGLNVAAAPKVDFSKFGETEVQKLSKIKRLTGVNTHRSWVTVPHVTQFDEADITGMEAFRKAKKEEAAKQGYKLTPLVFMMKAAVKCLQDLPSFNASLDETGENLILKKYFNIGVAVDTPNGLVVPVIRDVDKKGLYELSKELRDISTKAREKGLMPNEMSGSCFTISSLGGIGGTAFTPIVNTPDVAILGVSKSKMSPVWNGKSFEPRLMLPLSLSYDHRVIDGAQAARFTSLLSQYLSDIRELLL